MEEIILSSEKAAMERWRQGDPWGWTEISAMILWNSSIPESRFTEMPPYYATVFSQRISIQTVRSHTEFPGTARRCIQK